MTRTFDDGSGMATNGMLIIDNSAKVEAPALVMQRSVC